MHRVLTQQTLTGRNDSDDDGSALILAPLLLLLIVYMTGFFIDLAYVFAKAGGFDQTLALAAASGSTQISESAFYQKGLLVLDPVSAKITAISQLEKSMPARAALTGIPEVIVDGGGICISASEIVRLPFLLGVDANPDITYTSRASAIAKGSSTDVPPIC